MLRDDHICPIVDRLPGALSCQCIGQQIMLDVMDALFQLGNALRAPKGKPRYEFLVAAEKRLDDISSNMLAIRQRSKRYDKTEKKPARIITAAQYSSFLADLTKVYADLDTWMSSNAAFELKNRTVTSSD